jgi:hypothetical protein
LVKTKQYIGGRSSQTFALLEKGPAEEYLHDMSAEPKFLVVSWREKPELTSGQLGSLPLLQLLLTRTNQNKPELCSCRPIPGFVGRLSGEEGRVWQSTIQNNRYGYVWGGGEVNSNRTKILTFHLKTIIKIKFLKTVLKDIPSDYLE